jgi:hypothetical protein
MISCIAMLPRNGCLAAKVVKIVIVSYLCLMSNTILDEQAVPRRLELYDRFADEAAAQYLIALLKKHRVPYEVEKPRQLMDAIIIGESQSPKVFVKIFAEDFQRVNQLIETDTLNMIEAGKLDIKGHFLQDFSDDELKDVMRKPDEWNFDTTVIARHLLQQRGIEYTPDQIEEMQSQRFDELRKPQSGSKNWLITLFVIALFGGFSWHIISLLIAFPMAYYYWKDTSLDPQGQRFYTFDKKTRDLSRLILVLTVLAMIVRVLLSGNRNLSNLF